MKPRRNPDDTLSGLDLLEEAIHALRLAAPGTLLSYYIGAVPFVLAALFFWSDMSRSGLAEQHLVGGAIALSLLFVWMKIWQSIFALKLSAQIANEPSPKISMAALFRAVGSQALIHSTGLFLIPVAAQILLPIVWVFGFYQSATVLGLREPTLTALARRSWKQARWSVMQGHTAIAVLALFSIFVFFDICLAVLGAPHLLKLLMGLETDFTLSFASTVNTTFLAAAAGVTYLCIDPLIKAVYTMRCFYGESRATGEDLRVALRSFRTPAMAALILLLALGQLTFTHAAKVEPQPPTSARGTELDGSIERVLERAEYTWRSPRPKSEKMKPEESALWQRFRDWAKKTARAFFDWLDKAFGSKRTATGGGKFSFASEGFLYILIAAVLVIIGVLVWLLWRTRSRSSSAELEATPAAPIPDLARDDVAGDELPVDGWMKLALELLERGELRLAMRAFYLSSLAHLAGRNLVNIARFKSNRDYERELLRRSHALPDLSKTFSENVSVFDRVWYGRHDINGDLLQHFRTNVERIKEC
ncbi:MAG TPA: DUF4129 domain-containing protein [Verrucomicrobiae bacterium]|jgi:hypothetical protein